VGDSMNDIYRTVIQKVTGVIAWIDAWAERNPKLIKALGLAAMAIGAVMSSVGILLLALAPLVVIWAKMQLWAYMFPKAMAVVGMALTKLGTAWRVLTATMMTNPMVLAVAVLVAAGAALYYWWDEVSAFFKGFWQGLKQGLAPILTIWDSLKAAMAPLMPIFTQLGQWFDKFTQGSDSSKESLEGWQRAGQLAGQVVGLAINAITLPMRVMIELITRAVGIFMNMYDAAYVFLSIDPMGSIQELWGALPEWFAGLGASILEGLQAAWDLILALVGLDPMQSIGEAWAGVGAFFSNLGDQILGSIGNAIDGALGKLKELGNWFGNALGLDIFGSVPEELKEQVNEAPAKGSGDTAKVNDKPLTKGNQVKQVAPVVKYETNAPVEINITAAPGMTTDDLAAAFRREMEAYNRQTEQRNRSRVNDY
ncbi:MAG: hypothetical protein ACRCUF_18305, partial [Aeromonas sobria]